MTSRFTDFSDLKGLRKQLEKDNDKGGDPVPLPGWSDPSRTPARGQADKSGPVIADGSRVRMMDTNDTGIIVGKGRGYYEIEVDGLVIRATTGEFIPVDGELDRKMYDSVPAPPAKTPCKDLVKKTASDCLSDLTVDIHFDRIPGHGRVPERSALGFQMEYFHRIVRENLKHRGRRIVFIHGDGDGVLKNAVRRALEETYATSCRYTYGVCEQYGTGATAVTIR